MTDRRGTWNVATYFGAHRVPFDWLMEDSDVPATVWMQQPRYLRSARAWTVTRVIAIGMEDGLLVVLIKWKWFECGTTPGLQYWIWLTEEIWRLPATQEYLVLYPEVASRLRAWMAVNWREF